MLQNPNSQSMQRNVADISDINSKSSSFNQVEVQKGNSKNVSDLSLDFNTLSQFEAIEEEYEQQKNDQKQPKIKTKKGIQCNQNSKEKEDSFNLNQDQDLKTKRHQNEAEKQTNSHGNSISNQKDKKQESVKNLFGLEKDTKILKQQDKQKRFQKASLKEAKDWQQSKKIQKNQRADAYNEQNEEQKQDNITFQNSEKYKICEDIINIKEIGVGVQLYFEYIKMIAIFMIFATSVTFAMFIFCLIKGEDIQKFNIGFTRTSSVASYWLNEESIPEWFGILYLVNIILILLSLQ